VPADDRASLAGDAFLRTLVWLYMGSLFGAVFGLFLTALLALGQPYWLATVLAGACAAGAAAAFYAWSWVAILGTLVGLAASLITLIAAAGAHGPFRVVAVGGTLAAWVGALAGLFGTPNRTALAKMALGFVVGGLAAALTGLGGWLLPAGFDVVTITALTMLLAGTFYRLWVTPVVTEIGGKTPAMVSGICVAGGWGATVSLSIWVFAHTLASAADSAAAAALRPFLPVVLQALIGGALGGVIAGLLFAVLRTRWLDW
jgi:hypothetical protein